MLTLNVILLYCSVDTVKTRLQGQPHTRVQKYTSMVQAYKLILRQEGVMRGLYAGVTPAMIGSSTFSLYFVTLFLCINFVAHTHTQSLEQHFISQYTS